MPIIDAQLHEPPVSLKWSDASRATKWEVLLELQLAYMDAVGVDRVVLHPLELEWGRFAAARCPERFKYVPMIGIAAASQGSIDPASVPIDEFIDHESRQPGLAGIRIVRSADGGWLDEFGPTIAACARSALPLFVYTTGDLTAPATIAVRYPNLTIIVDHLGLPRGENKDHPAFRDLPQLLALAQFANIAVKLSGTPAMSDSPYPYADLWPHLRLIVDAFGPQRLMWGTDISRLMGSVGFHYSTRRRANHTYAEALLHLRESPNLSPSEKHWILGGTAERLLYWSDDSRCQ